MHDSRAVLMLAYYFPPTSGPGVYRSLKFARYLPDEGFVPVIVTGPGEEHHRWNPADQSLVSELPELAVYRARSQPPYPSKLSKLMTRWLRLASPFRRWWIENVLELGRKAIAEHDIAVIYASLAPYETLAPALELGREARIPVVADLRDPWALDEGNVYPTALHRGLDRGEMGRTLRLADAVIMNTPEAQATAQAAFPDIPSERFSCITNGYDASDFEQLPSPATNGTFSIVHVGFLHSNLTRTGGRLAGLKKALGGTLIEIDYSGRTHIHLIAALELLAERCPQKFEHIRLRLVGPLTDADRAVVEASKIADRIETPGHVDHTRAVAALAEADVLFLPMYDVADGFRTRIVPAKTYEYLASGRPILAALPEGDAKDFVLEAQAGQVVTPCDVEEIAAAIEAFVDAGHIANRPLSERIERFERRQLTKRLADVFRGVLTPKDG